MTATRARRPASAWTARAPRRTVGSFLFGALSDDGRFVAFASDASNLVAGDTNGARDIFVHEQVVACQGPVISDVSAAPNVLWPANHKMVPVVVGYTVADDCDPAPLCSLSIGGNKGGSGDWEVLDVHNVNLRAEREGKGDGRIYTITISCQNSQDLSSSATVAVIVPHDRRN